MTLYYNNNKKNRTVHPRKLFKKMYNTMYFKPFKIVLNNLMLSLLILIIPL